MKSLSLNTIRSLYLEFFEKRGHLVLPSFSLVPNNDPSILLINAGMAPLKAWFTGAETPPNARVATCQKCIRTPDIEHVGRTGRHGTFFEMLGNFSFGDYFKKEAIQWAWEYSVNVLEWPRDRIYVTVHLDDDEAYDLWIATGVPPERVKRFGKENFWEHGTGPCGPCSELFFDRGEQYGCGSPDCGVGCECDRYLEYWNLVFTQFNKLEDGSYVPLEKKNIDTGAGLERIAAISQDVGSMFEVDTIRAILDRVCEQTGTVYAKSGEESVSVRVITDHVRSAMMMISDGILPGNEGRGYVLRRLIRRALRHGRLLGVDQPFLGPIVRTAISQSRDHYPELEDEELIIAVVEAEEKRFDKTIRQGLALLTEACETEQKKGSDTVPGDVAFLLHDTFGFPVELSVEIANEMGLQVDVDAFNTFMKRQRTRAREDFLEKTSTAWGTLSLPDPVRDLAPTLFTGYEELERQTPLRFILQSTDDKQTLTQIDHAVEGQDVYLVTDASPFYAMGGGQTSDTGSAVQEGAYASIVSTEKTGDGIVLHRSKVTRGVLRPGLPLTLTVESKERKATARNHTATHLLHAALRGVLGEQTTQKGSFVSPRRLRFDFQHDGPVPYEKLRTVESLVNRAILDDLPVTTDTMPIDDARSSGAVALFGERYDEDVRVVSCGTLSRELCGGTHLKSTGEIALFRIVSESGIASGIRRIEAVTGERAVEEASLDAATINRLQQHLRAPREDLFSKVEAMDEQIATLRDQVKQLEREKLTQSVDDLTSKEEIIDPYHTLLHVFPGYDAQGLREAGDRFRDRLGEDAVILLAGTSADKVLWLAMAGSGAVAKGIRAGDLVREAAKLTGGGGGGRPDMAQAGGRDTGKVDEALSVVRELIQAKAETWMSNIEEK
ncbi:MAG TPA: alanine--tRNA ligase [Clostridia bacterium]|nr:alanine--tRNA ligase [Clostridia bacterium]